MTKRFKQNIIDLNKIIEEFEKSKAEFKFACEDFMRSYGIEDVKLIFFGDAFGLDLYCSNTSKIPLAILVDFCNEFGCTFEYTNSDGHRYIFSFDGLNMGYNL